MCPLARLLLDQLQVVRSQQRHQDTLLIDDSLMLFGRSGLHLWIAAVETVLECVEELKEIFHGREELLAGLLDDELGCHTMLLANFYRFC